MQLSKDDQLDIRTLIKKSRDPRVICRANALNMRDKGLTAIEVADFLEITSRTVFNIQANYASGGLQKALHDDPRPGAPIQFDQRVKSHIVALVCSDPPDGFDTWTLELIQRESKKRGIVRGISKEKIRIILKEHDLKPWQQQSWCIPEINQEFIDRMEDVLAEYEMGHNPRKPLICLDEKNLQLLENVRSESGLTPGRPARRDYEYKRNGSANVFMAVEPLTGHFVTRVTERRTGDDFAKFLRSLERRYHEADKIRIVMDNLNTHCERSLIRFYGEEEGQRIWSRFEVHHSPKHGSWLNQAEIAIGMYSRQCLGRSRIPDITMLRKRTEAWTRVVNQRNVIIQWRFSRVEARAKFNYKP